MGSNKTRVPNKVQWGLADIIAESRDARSDWNRAMKAAERDINPEIVVLLAHLGSRLANIELRAKDALNGEYYEKR